MTLASTNVRPRHDLTLENTMAGKFEIYADKAGKFRFRLKAANGEVVATGEAYESKSGAIKGTEAVQRAADGAPVVDLT